jgi:hypothetical protein
MANNTRINSGAPGLAALVTIAGHREAMSSTGSITEDGGDTPVVANDAGDEPRSADADISAAAPASINSNTSDPKLATAIGTGDAEVVTIPAFAGPSGEATSSDAQPAASNPPAQQVSDGEPQVVDDAGEGTAAAIPVSGMRATEQTAAAPSGAVSIAPLAAAAQTGAADTAIAAASELVAAASPAPIISFPGPVYQTGVPGAPVPADCSLAVGPAHVIAIVNSRIQWYDKSGALQSDQGQFNFFGRPALAPGFEGLAEARVVFDEVNDRFVICSTAGTNLFLAVSRDADPNHGWNVTSIPANLIVNGQPTWADLPGLATDGEAIYVTAFMKSAGADGEFRTNDDPVQESHLWIVSDGIGTGGFYDGGPIQLRDFAGSVVTGGMDNLFGHPAQMLSPAPGSIGTFLVSRNPSTPGGRLGVIRIDNPTTAPTFNFQVVTGAPSQPFSQQASQPGTATTFELDIAGNAVWRNGSLYAVGVVGPTSGPDAGIATAHWSRIDTSNLDALTIADAGDIGGSLLGAGAGVATYQASISANAAGDFLVNFSASGPNLFLGAYYAMHAAGDAPGTIRGPQVLHVGEDVYELRNSDGEVRFGDYSGIAVDPADDSTFWLFHQYAALRPPGESGKWGTQIAAVPAAAVVPPGVGGRWIFSPPAGFNGLVLGINNGVAPVFPLPQPGAFNIEVFTNPSLVGQPGIPNPNAGFQSSIADPGGTLESGFLTGTDLRLTTGDFLLVDSVTGAAAQSPSKVTLGSGNQTVVGARFDTLVGGSGNQILSALVGNQTVVGGTGNASVWGGASDSIVAGTGANQQIVLTGSLTTVVAGMGGNATISAAAQVTIRSLGGSTQNVIIAGGVNGLIDLTGNSGLDAVIGAVGDTIVAGQGTTNIEGVSGGMRIVVGAGGTTNISGSGVLGLGNTIIGGAGNLGFNPSAQIGQGDLFNLSGSTGNATINAFSFGAARIASPDTIVAGNGSDSVFGGDGDRIGTGNGPVVAGTHLWDHSDTLAGTAVGFGSNDTVASTVYDTVAGTATRHPEIAGTSFAMVTVTNFTTTTDFLFYQNENTATTDAIIATSQATTVAGTPSTVITLPDGTVMTMVGIIQAQLIPALFKP